MSYILSVYGLFISLSKGLGVSTIVFYFNEHTFLYYKCYVHAMLRLCWTCVFYNVILMLCLGYAGLWFRSLDLIVHIDLFYLGSYGYRFMALKRPYLM